MTFALSHFSLTNLLDVHPDLQKLVNYVIGITPVDFGIICGLRSVTQQKDEVAAGRSKTMRSRHLTGHAIDFEADVNGQGSWDDGLYYQIAGAFQRGSIALSIPVTWGGVWDQELSALGPDLNAAVQAYHARQQAKGVTNPLTDLDHIELARSAYPDQWRSS